MESFKLVSYSHYVQVFCIGRLNKVVLTLKITILVLLTTRLNVKRHSMGAFSVYRVMNILE